MTTRNTEITTKKYHVLATIAAFISVIVVGVLALVFGPLLIVAVIVYRGLFPKKEKSARELADEEWQLKHHDFVVSRHQL